MYGLRDKQADHLNALQCQLMTNLQRPSTEAPFRLDDFLLYGDPPPQQSQEEIEENLRLAFAPMVKK